MPEKLEERIVPRPAMDRPSDELQESVILRKVALRLIPFLFLLYIVNIVDRMNVGFAKLRMLEDLGLDEKVYGLGAGMFYVGYMLFEVPEQPDPAPGRGPPMDQPDHGQLGDHLGLHDVRAGRVELLPASGSCSGSPRRASSPASSST